MTTDLKGAYITSDGYLNRGVKSHLFTEKQYQICAELFEELATFGINISRSRIKKVYSEGREYLELEVEFVEGKNLQELLQEHKPDDSLIHLIDDLYANLINYYIYKLKSGGKYLIDLNLSQFILNKESEAILVDLDPIYEDAHIAFVLKEIMKFVKEIQQNLEYFKPKEVSLTKTLSNLEELYRDYYDRFSSMLEPLHSLLEK